MIPFPDISPEIFTITLAGREFSLRWYAMAYLVGLLLGWAIVAVTVPMIVALLHGQPVELAYRVRDAAGVDPRCDRPVKLRDLPITFDRICGVDDAARGRLSPGMPVNVQGTGTMLGLFPERIGVAQAPAGR